MPKHLFISCWKWQEKWAERGVTEVLQWWLLLHLPQIFCIFPSAGSQAWDQPKDLSVPSTLTLTVLLFSFPGLQQKISQWKEIFFPVHQKIWGQLTWVSFETVSSWTDWATCGPGFSCECWGTRNLYKGPTRLIWQLVPFHHPVVAGGHEKGGGCYWAQSIFMGYWLGFNPRGTQIKAEGGWFCLSPGKGAASQVCHVPVLHSPAWPAQDMSLGMVQTPSLQL